MTDPNATPYPFDCEPESKVAKCDAEAMERKLAEYETAARMRAMTSEREIEALAQDIVRTVVKHTGYPAHHFHGAATELARRLQPARVPEKRVTEAAKAISTVRQGNTHAYRMYLDDARAALSAAPAPEAVRAKGETVGPVLVDSTVGRKVAEQQYGVRYGIDWAYHCDRRGLLSEREAFPAAHPAPPPADHSPGAGNMVPDAGQREGVEATLRRAADMLDGFEKALVRYAPIDDIEEWPYHPEITETAETLRRLASAPQPTQRGEGVGDA